MRSCAPACGLLRATRNSKLATSPPGFTLIELLVVIGIILILIGLFFAGAKIVTAQARERDTKSMLETYKTMFDNYQQATNLVMVPAPSASNPNYNPKGNNLGALANPAISITGFNLINGGSFTGAQAWALGQESMPTNSQGIVMPVSPEGMELSVSPFSSRSIGFPAVLRNTEIMMAAMLSVPQNQTIVNNLPANKIYVDAYTKVPLLLDGWGNIIMFCPGGGLSGVWVDPAFNSPEIITSAGVQQITYNPAPASAGAFVPPVSNQPFFVSAGPDGDLSNRHGWVAGNPVNSSMTDDNIYSFQN